MNGGDLRIDLDRLLGRIAELGEIGRIDGPAGEWGNARLALTDDDRARARAGRVVDAGPRAERGRSTRSATCSPPAPGSDPDAAPVMTGSHIDTVRTGGRYDGNLGVLAGLEVAETLEQHGIVTERPFVVAFFTDEEGARFPPDMLGSLVFAGGMPLEVALDIASVDDGARLGDELERIGFAGPLPCPTAVPPHRFVELHIEQGPILEAEGVDIGVVEGVQGISWTEIPSPASRPMPARRRCGCVTTRATSPPRSSAFVRDSTARDGRRPGRHRRPDRRPAQPGQRRSVDRRGHRRPPQHRRGRVGRRPNGVWTTSSERVAAAEGVTVERRSLARFEPVDFDPEMIDVVEATARKLGHSTRRMPSGAGHDAQMLARLCPTAMIFTPSVAGLSHNIAEYTEASDLEAGANVLLHVVLDQLGTTEKPD